MMGQGESSETSHGRFMQVVRAELEKFERTENEFLKNDRDERAARLAVLTASGGDILAH
jgi:hypothetical protein